MMLQSVFEDANKFINDAYAREAEAKAPDETAALLAEVSAIRARLSQDVDRQSLERRKKRMLRMASPALAHIIESIADGLE